MCGFRWVKRAAAIGLMFAGVNAQAQESAQCGAPSDACIASCKRFNDKGDPRLMACENFCRKQARIEQACAMEAAAKDESRSMPEVLSLTKKGEALAQRDLNAQMLTAIAEGNLPGIRRLIESRRMNPTYVYSYEYNPTTRSHEGRAIRLRLADVFNDTNTLRNDKQGSDRSLALFIELGMDVTATLPDSKGFARTAWGPSLKTMERARDREARMRAFELALDNGLKPNDDVGDWLFAELPQVCGRDRSQFAIQVIDLLVEYLGASLQENFWRAGNRGPETVADVLDRLISPGHPKNDYERTQFALMDETWTHCGPLSRRINRYLMQGN